MKAVLALVFQLMALPVAAESMALDYYEQCVGPAYLVQASAKYQDQQCQFSESCEPFEAADFVADVESHCVSIAAEICLVSGDGNACFDDVISRLEARTALVSEAFSPKRAAAAVQGKTGLAARALRLQLDQHEAVLAAMADYCPEPREVRRLQSFGLERETVCALRQALLQNSVVHQRARRTLALEALTE